jgi:pyridoxine/pyridoxamine 5'-phosphate oxidase
MFHWASYESKICGGISQERETVIAVTQIATRSYQNRTYNTNNGRWASEDSSELAAQQSYERCTGDFKAARKGGGVVLKLSVW